MKLEKDMRGKRITPEQETEIARRRFGRDHGDPCIKADCITCALWQCQVAGECQWNAT